MNIEQNKDDMAARLEDLQTLHDELVDILDSDKLRIIQDTIDEWQHIESDINELWEMWKEKEKEE